ncbi:PAS domain-containing sensor histidine kinase [Haloterrigena longa]|uniref:histidine kinase n=2 Tax=Natrinema longum TaxID=370324 RepID=A0A8A2UFA4_9EURY|nr:PAS domain-containing sensor histidine kinase [Natrinema longum]QSW86952.1 PAS domain-containing sensor histidine kinase [Natrinema longum]
MVGQNVSVPGIFDGMTVGITVHDPETGEIIDMNERVEQLYGYSKSELRTMSIEEYTAPSSQFTKKEAVDRIRTAARGDPQTFEWKVKRKNGEYRWISVHLTRTTIGGTKCIIAEINDITEYKTREQLIQLLNRVIRHNLRNDMNLLIGYADRIKTAIQNDQLQEEVDTILNIASEVGTLSDSLDQIERIVEPGTTEREPTNLRTVVETCASETLSENTAVDISVTGPSDIWVTADEGLRYAIEHGIENAVTHNDSETPTVTLTVTEDPENGFGVVRIMDNGPPIPDMEIEVLDDETVMKSTYHGSGVGLWVMKWCVDSLGGELSFEAKTPRGNVVQIALPQTDQPPIE